MTGLSRRRRRRLAFSTAFSVVVGAVGWLAWTYVLQPQQAVEATLEEVPRVEGVFDIPEETRPTSPVPVGTSDTGPSGETFLLVGSDSRGEAQGPGDGPWRVGEQRSDVIMLGRVFGSGELGLVSIPRDSWVEIPGHGPGKINAAFSYGGPSLLVETVEEETGVRVDHFAMVDFEGLVAVTDAIGGVTVTSPRASSYGGHAFVKGENRLDGEKALAFLRQRKGLPNGDLDRVENQQRFLRAMLGQALSRSVASSPERLDAVLDAVLEHVEVDDQTSPAELREMAQALGSTPSSSVVAGTAPVSGLGREGAQSVVYLDRGRAPAAWAALRDDDASALHRALTGEP